MAAEGLFIICLAEIRGEPLRARAQYIKTLRICFGYRINMHEEHAVSNGVQNISLSTMHEITHSLRVYSFPTVN